MGSLLFQALKTAQCVQHRLPYGHAAITFIPIEFGLTGKEINFAKSCVQ